MSDEILQTVLCTFGLALVALWLMARFYPQGPALPVRAVISGHGDGSDLEDAVRALMRLRSLGLLRCPVYLLTDGLSPQGQELARHLRCRWPAVTLISEGDLNRWIQPA